MNQRGFTIILIAVVVIGILAGIVYTLKRQAQQFFTFTFEECIKSRNSKIVSTFPRQCLSNDGKTYIEKVTEPVDTSNWTIFNEVKGFSFRCPPSWNCQKSADTSVTISQNHYLNISTFEINLITPSNYKKSLVSHPSYKDPISWYKDMLARQLSSPIYRPGIEEYRNQMGANYDPSFGEHFETITGIKGIALPSRGVAFVPLNNSDLIFIEVFPYYYLIDPIVKAIISSIIP